MNQDDYAGQGPDSIYAEHAKLCVELEKLRRLVGDQDDNPFGRRIQQLERMNDRLMTMMEGLVKVLGRSDYE